MSPELQRPVRKGYGTCDEMIIHSYSPGLYEPCQAGSDQAVRIHVIALIEAHASVPRANSMKRILTILKVLVAKLDT